MVKQVSDSCKPWTVAIRLLVHGILLGQNTGSGGCHSFSGKGVALSDPEMMHHALMPLGECQFLLNVKIWFVIYIRISGAKYR